MPQFQTLSARLTASKPLSHFTSHLQFEVEGSDTFGFVAGQWLSFRGNKPDGEEITRAYSIASPPNGDRQFALCLNRVQDGFMSNHLCDLSPGSKLSFQGPFGNFIFRPPMRDTLLIATGTGIAPFRSMLHWLLAEESRHQHKQVWLLYGSRTESDIYYHDEFRQLAREHSNFNYLPTLSRGTSAWQGLKGYVQEHVPALVGDRTDMHAYICGLKKMIAANRDLLKALGWDRKSIIYEAYD